MPNPRPLKRQLIRLGIGLSILFFVALIPCLIYFQSLRQSRPAKEPLQTSLFQGIDYQRSFHSEPRPTVWHIVRIDMLADGISVVVTPPDTTSSMDTLARTTSQFLSEFNVQVAINGSFFRPFHSRSVIDYYPKVDDPVDVLGIGIADGVRFSNDKLDWPIVAGQKDEVTGKHHVRIFKPTESMTQHDSDNANESLTWAMAGRDLVVDQGQTVSRVDPAFVEDLHPRTAVAVNREGTVLWLIIVDGRQSGYSEGATLAELGNRVVALGAWMGLNLDGGGSTTLVVDEAGTPRVMNAPYHTRFPMRERPVANHLGVRAKAIQ